MALDSLTLKAIAFELSEKLIGGKIDKINQAENDEILLSIRSNSINYKLLLSANSSNPRTYLVNSYKKENPLKAPMFLMILRKHLGNGRIISINQSDFDRSLSINIESYDEMRVLTQKSLHIEIMGKHSNIILVDIQSGKVIDSIKRIPLSVSSVREVLPNRLFAPPPSQNKLSPLEIYSFEEFQNILLQNQQRVFKAIYLQFQGISPVIAKELCFKASIDINLSIQELSKTQFENLKISFDQLFLNLKENNYSPCIMIDPATKRAQDFSIIPLTQFQGFDMIQSDSISETCEKFYLLKDLKERISQKTSGLKKSISIKLERIKSKLEKQNQELSIAKDLESHSKTGELLKANIYSITKGMKEITVIDYFDESYPEVTILLDENRTPAENVQQYYKKYTKAKNRIKELSVQIDQSEQEYYYLDNVMLSINNCESLDSIEEIKEELVIEGYYRPSKIGKKQKKKEVSSPMEFVSSDGTTIYIGKNNIQNDMLTLKLSRPSDVWLHTKNIPGSHVIIKSTLEEVSNETLYEAATLAAYFSKARNSSKVPVDYTPRKNVKKPGGSKPGMVIYDDYGTVYVTPSELLVFDLTKK